MNAVQGMLRDTHVTLSHGGGGKAMRNLITDVFTSVFKPDGMEDQARLHDAMLTQPGARIAMTTDSFVVDPVEFPGGDIGTLAVCGTINDLAVGGARPLWLSAAFIIEEGTEIALLRRIVSSMACQAEMAGVQIVTGDTKVVARGAADKLFITTSGIGLIQPDRNLTAANIRPGDSVIVSGMLGNHGAAILAARGEMALDTGVQSDCQSLHIVMESAINAAPGIRAARDATRGGLASALNEMAAEAGVSILLQENCLPMRSDVRGVCEILGLDPLYLANEGTLVLFAPPDQTEDALAAIRATEAGRDACIIGYATERNIVPVSMTTLFGGNRIVDMLIGEQLPRIC